MKKIIDFVELKVPIIQISFPYTKQIPIIHHNFVQEPTLIIMGIKVSQVLGRAAEPNRKADAVGI